MDAVLVRRNVIGSPRWLHQDEVVDVDGHFCRSQQVILVDPRRQIALAESRPSFPALSIHHVDDAVVAVSADPDSLELKCRRVPAVASGDPAVELLNDQLGIIAVHRSIIGIHSVQVTPNAMASAT